MAFRGDLCPPPSILILVRQGADLGASKRPVSGRVTVYLPPKSAVYRQVYRHEMLADGRIGETMIDSRIVKSRVISMAYGHPGTK